MEKPKLNKDKMQKAFEQMSPRHQKYFKQLMSHSQEYVVDKKPFIATANHLEDKLYITHYGVTVWQGGLDEYTNFAGNMQRFVELKARIVCH
mgnify:CR=1 FL=1